MNRLNCLDPRSLSTRLLTHLPSGLLAAWLTALPSAGQALPTHSWSEDLSTPGQISAVASDGLASTLDGARATVFYSDGSSDQALFVGTASGLDLFSVAQTPAFTVVASTSGSSASFPAFSISNTDQARTLVGFRIDGAGDGNGHAAFDRGLGVSSTGPSTAGSASGIDLSLDFSRRSFLTGTVAITYSRPLGLNGAAPVGDLFGSVAVQMNLSTVLGLPPVTQLSGVFSSIDFSTDIDAVVYAATAPVPEPAGWALLLAGGAVLAGRQRLGGATADWRRPSWSVGPNGQVADGRKG